METERASDLTLSDAFRAVEKATRYEEPLRRRAEGVTTMVWGVVTLGALLSMPASEAALGWPWMTVVLVAWILAGVGLSKGVWTFAAAAEPRLRPSPARTALAALVIFGLWNGLIAVANLVWPSSEGGGPAGIGLVMLGSFWAVPALLRIRPTTTVGRRARVVVGALLAVVGVLYVALQTHAPPREVWGPLLLALPAGGIPFLAGFWQTLRG